MSQALDTVTRSARLARARLRLGQRKEDSVRRYSALWLCLFVGLLADADAFAQSQATSRRSPDAWTTRRGRPAGRDGDHASEDTGYTRTVVTGDDGLYTLALIPPGTYEMTAELAGFATATIQRTLTVGATVSVNVTLPVAGVTENVTVTGGAQSSRPARRSGRQRSTAGDREPADQRPPLSGLRHADADRAGRQRSADSCPLPGQRGINSNISIDGADYNQPFFGGIRGGERSNFAFTIPQEAIQEFQVVASGYSAEFGRSHRRSGQRRSPSRAPTRCTDRRST